MLVLGGLRLDELPFYPLNKSNVFGRVSYNVLERDNIEDKIVKIWHAKPNKIIRIEIQDINLVLKVEIAHNDIKLLRESACRIRKKHFSKISTTTNETFDQLFETQVDIKTNNEQFDCVLSIDKSKLFCLHVQKTYKILVLVTIKIFY